MTIQTEPHIRELPTSWKSRLTLWYCVADCPNHCSVQTTLSEPVFVRGGHCIEFLSPKVRGKAVWKKGISLEDKREKVR